MKKSILVSFVFLALVGCNANVENEEKDYGWLIISRNPENGCNRTVVVSDDNTNYDDVISITDIKLNRDMQVLAKDTTVLKASANERDIYLEKGQIGLNKHIQDNGLILPEPKACLSSSN